MKANELRVGNLVNDVASQPFKVAANCIVALVQSEIAGKINLGYNGIPLTEEWLNKLGFTKQKSGPYQAAVCGWHPYAYYFIVDGYQEFSRGFKQPIQKHDFVIVNTSGRSVDLSYQYAGIKTKGAKLEYVHQLQNLYFALTGEELNITL